MQDLWVEKYRPKSVEEYVFKNNAHKKQVCQWIADKSIPHLLLSGHAGIGKTSLAKLLIHQLAISPMDVMEINASRERGIDIMRDNITNFISMMPIGDYKVVLLDEADYLTGPAQATLRGVFEEFHEFSRFILTCNQPHNLIPALHSRCHSIHFEKIDQTEFTARVATILLAENIKPDIDILDTFVKATYPDLRKCINLLQQNVQDGSLLSPTESNNTTTDWMIEMVELFKAGKIQKARRLLCGSIRPEEMELVYRWLYDNIELFGDENQQDSAIHIIKAAMVDHPIVIDPEINLASCLIRLANL
tara:strand:- start:109 stop:1023 length:915 start_codon:yes stop_codon:yes gene_type:complete